MAVAAGESLAPLRSRADSGMADAAAEMSSWHSSHLHNPSSVSSKLLWRKTLSWVEQNMLCIVVPETIHLSLGHFNKSPGNMAAFFNVIRKSLMSFKASIFWFRSLWVIFQIRRSLVSVIHWKREKPPADVNQICCQPNFAPHLPGKWLKWSNLLHSKTG